MTLVTDASGDLIKVCPACKQGLPLAQFGFRDAQKGTKVSRCKACVKAYSKAHYHSNKKVYLEQAAASNAKKIRQNKAFMADFLAKCECSLCKAKEDLHPYTARDSKVKPPWMLLTGSTQVLSQALSSAQILCGECLQKHISQFLHDWQRLSGPEKSQKTTDSQRKPSKPKRLKQETKAKNERIGNFWKLQLGQE